jgi:hypothetical protein
MMANEPESEQTTTTNCEMRALGSQAEGTRPKKLCPDYLGEFPVSLGENAKTYESFLSEMVNYYNPSDPIEWIHVRDIADSQWQMQRMQRASATWIDLAKVRALEQMLSSSFSELQTSARSYAQGYFQHCPEARPFVQRLLQDVGLTEAAIPSAAVAMRAADIDRMGRMAMLQKAFRDDAISNLDRHRKNQVRAACRAFPVQDAEYRVIEDNSKDQREGA